MLVAFSASRVAARSEAREKGPPCEAVLAQSYVTYTGSQIMAAASQVSPDESQRPSLGVST